MKRIERTEMKKIMGGTIMYCCVHSPGWSSGPTQCANVEPADAQALAQQNGQMWCCSSCDQSRAAAGLPPMEP